MTEETTETSFSSSRINRRNQLDAKKHRKVRRDYYPDYIYKHIVNGEKFTENSQAQVSNPDLYCAIEQNDPFDIGSFDVRFSLNKKGRWEIADELASNIVSYQDDLMDVRVSYLKTVLRDCGWIFRDDKWQESNKAFDTEYAGVKDGCEIHKQTKKANKYDLMKTPKRSKKSKKGRAVRGDFSTSDKSQESDSKIHVLYETSSTIWDGRIRDKCDRKAAQAKRQQRIARSKTAKYSSRARKLHLKDISEMLEDEVDDTYMDDLSDADEDYAEEECPEHQCILEPADFMEVWTKVPDKKANPRTGNIDENYTRWLQTPSYMEFTEEGKSTFATVDFPTEISEDVWDKTLLSWEDDVLPFRDISLPAGTTLEQYVSQHAKNFRKVDEMIPEHYLCESTSEQGEIAALIEKRDVYVIMRISPDNQHAVRWIVNAKIETVNEGISYKPYPKTWNPAQLCPAKAFLPVECLEEDLLEQSSVIGSVSTEKEDQRIDLKSSNSVTCGVCLSEIIDGFALRCGHFFCRTCWMVHSRESLLSGNVPIYCMSDKCSKFLTLEQALTFLPVSQCEKYKAFLWRLISTQDRFFRCTKCDRIMHFPAGRISQNSLAVCQCQYIWCLGCRRRAHQPVPCEFATKYYDFLQKIGKGEEDPIELPVVSARKCPKCRYAYQRYIGCHVMTCPVCNTVFCDNCGVILAHHYATHSCVKTAPEDIVLLDVMKNEDKFMQALFERCLWFYRKMRMQIPQARFKRDIILAGLEYDPSFYVFFAAIEVLELCDAFLRFTKQQFRQGNFSGRIEPKKRIRREAISDRFRLLAFDILRFREAVERRQKERIQEWKERTEKHVREMLQLGYPALPQPEQKA